MKKKNIFLFTPWFMGVLFIVFAMAMAFATFYENDFGARAARSLVYETKWFELIMLLMIVNLLGQIFQYKLYKRKKLTVLLFHLAFILMIIGAAITRYIGFEGTVHIRENSTQNICTSIDQYAKFTIKDFEGKDLYSDTKRLNLTPVRKAKYSRKIKIDDIKYALKLKEYVTNAAETIVEVPNGRPVVSLLLSRGMMAREIIFLSEGQIKQVGNLLFGFGEGGSVDVRITFRDGEFRIQSEYNIIERSMMKEEAITHEKGEEFPLGSMKIYNINDLSVVAENLSKSGVIRPVKVNSRNQQTNKSAVVFDLAYGNRLVQLYLWLGPRENNTLEFRNGGHIIELSYGSMDIELPFSIKLEDFILDRYPGSSSPSSYKSDVVLIDEPNGVLMPYSIYMNNILKHKGWRFFQSSYDRDELGTILSANKDFAGMMVSYAGYFLLFLFIILSLLNKNSTFRTISKSHFKPSVGKTTAILILLLTVTTSVYSQGMPAGGNGQKLVVEKSLANDLGKVLVQNQKGRTEPLYALSNDILRKVSRKTELDGYSPMQIFLGLYFDFESWREVPMVKISSQDIKNMLGIRGEYAAFTDIVDMRTNNYRLKEQIDAAYSKEPGARSKFDKEVIKVDERLNICFMVYSGDFMKIFPVNDPGMKWKSPKDAYKFVSGTEDSLYLRNIVGLLAQGIQSGSQTGDYLQAKEIVKSIITYQRNFAQYELPSERKVNAEIFYYKSKTYDRLFPFYTTLGFVLLFILLYGIISKRKKLNVIINVFKGLLFIGFIFHTIGLAVRWYVSGHAPMSNGYESMIFISWVTVLAGFIFSKRSAFVVAATSVLGGFTLMVAHLSFMDPEITNLVPVLQSYWLTVHVSVITSSYGFLGLGAIIGFIVLVLYALSNKNNKTNILETIEELTVINYKSLTIGLYLLTIGTFLGAVWANESWGRYWGWDPKETWSLITVIIYSFIIHSRMIKGLRGLFAFNLMAVFGFASVLMTYFGVNYYLSGLHSYAAGDPVPIPTFVPVSVVVLVALSVVGYFKFRKEYVTTGT